ncbi:MAG: aspartate-semialdehyde dehydrogenase [Elusimicrobia bacterium]|nr:MAG: aspartate-semialdehyde dehydrogenase [Elusimicrobiota bacterium]
MAGLRVGVVGATGMVGRVLLERLSRSRFPVGKLLPFSSGRRKVSVPFRGKRVAAPAISRSALESCDLVFLVSSDEVSLEYGRSLAKKGVWVIDDSSAFRMAADVPLIIPEVNEDALRRNKRLIAGPNCTTAGLAVALKPLHDKAGLKRLRMASYQAVSGAGREALFEFFSQLKKSARVVNGSNPLPRLPALQAAAFPKPIAMSVLPHIGPFDANEDSKEELKVRREMRKLFGLKKLEVSTTAVRVPVIRGHSLAVWIETKKSMSPAAARRVLQKAAGVKLWKTGAYPTPDIHGTGDPTHVARVRRSGTNPRELSLWIVSDNLLKGAALNSIQIAEVLRKRGWLTPRGKGGA